MIQTLQHLKLRASRILAQKDPRKTLLPRSGQHESRTRKYLRLYFGFIDLQEQVEIMDVIDHDELYLAVECPHTEAACL